MPRYKQVVIPLENAMNFGAVAMYFAPSIHEIAKEMQDSGRRPKARQKLRKLHTSHVGFKKTDMHPDSGFD